MFKLLIVLFVSFSAIFSGNITCDPELKETFQKTMELQGVRDLVSRVQQEGDFSIKINRHLSKSFEGYWSTDRRTVYITKGRESSMLTTLLFELHNAEQDREFTRLYTLAEKGRISKKNYIESMERLEYQNALNTTALLDEGIEKGIFPTNSRWDIPETFEEHYRIQRSTGHSAWIGKGYNELRGRA